MNLINKSLNLFFTLFLINAFLFYAVGEEKVLDLGEIEITGEVRKPNINLIYSKKYMNKALTLIAKEELKKFEKELLKPARKMSLKMKSKKKKKPPVTHQGKK